MFSKPKQPAGNSVSFKTFEKWGVSAHIGYVRDPNQYGSVCKVWCKTCAKYSTRIRTQLKGRAVIDVDSYVVGTNCSWIVLFDYVPLTCLIKKIVVSQLMGLLVNFCQFHR